MESLFCCVLKHPDVFDSMAAMHRHRKKEKRRRKRGSNSRRRRWSLPSSSDDTATTTASWEEQKETQQRKMVACNFLPKTLRSFDLISSLDDALVRNANFTNNARQFDMKHYPSSEIDNDGDGKQQRQQEEQDNLFCHPVVQQTDSATTIPMEAHFPLSPGSSHPVMAEHGYPSSPPFMNGQHFPPNRHPVSEVFIEKKDSTTRQVWPVTVDSFGDTIFCEEDQRNNKSLIRFFDDLTSDESALESEPPSTSLFDDGNLSDNNESTTSSLFQQGSVLLQQNSSNKNPGEGIFQTTLRYDPIDHDSIDHNPIDPDQALSPINDQRNSEDDSRFNPPLTPIKYMSIEDELDQQLLAELSEDSFDKRLENEYKSISIQDISDDMTQMMKPRRTARSFFDEDRLPDDMFPDNRSPDDRLNEEEPKMESMTAKQSSDQPVATEERPLTIRERRRNRIQSSLQMRPPTPTPDVMPAQKSKVAAATSHTGETKADIQGNFTDESLVIAHMLAYTLMDNATKANLVKEALGDKMESQTETKPSKSKSRSSNALRGKLKAVIIVPLLTLTGGMTCYVFQPKLPFISHNIKKNTFGGSYMSRKLQALNARHRASLWTGITDEVLSSRTSTLMATSLESSLHTSAPDQMTSYDDVEPKAIKSTSRLYAVHEWIDSGLDGGASSITPTKPLRWESTKDLLVRALDPSRLIFTPGDDGRVDDIPRIISLHTTAMDARVQLWTDEFLDSSNVDNRTLQSDKRREMKTYDSVHEEKDYNNRVIQSSKEMQVGFDLMETYEMERQSIPSNVTPTTSLQERRLATKLPHSDESTEQHSVDKLTFPERSQFSDESEESAYDDHEEVKSNPTTAIRRTSPIQLVSLGSTPMGRQLLSASIAPDKASLVKGGVEMKSSHGLRPESSVGNRTARSLHEDVIDNDANKMHFDDSANILTTSSSQMLKNLLVYSETPQLDALNKSTCRGSHGIMSVNKVNTARRNEKKLILPLQQFQKSDIADTDFINESRHKVNFHNIPAVSNRRRVRSRANTSPELRTLKMKERRIVANVARKASLGKRKFKMMYASHITTQRNVSTLSVQQSQNLSDAVSQSSTTISDTSSDSIDETIVPLATPQSANKEQKLAKNSTNIRSIWKASLEMKSYDRVSQEMDNEKNLILSREMVKIEGVDGWQINQMRHSNMTTSRLSTRSIRGRPSIFLGKNDPLKSTQMMAGELGKFNASTNKSPLLNRTLDMKSYCPINQQISDKKRSTMPTKHLKGTRVDEEGSIANGSDGVSPLETPKIPITTSIQLWINNLFEVLASLDTPRVDGRLIASKSLLDVFLAIMPFSHDSQDNENERSVTHLSEKSPRTSSDEELNDDKPHKVYLNDTKNNLRTCNARRWKNSSSNVFVSGGTQKTNLDLFSNSHANQQKHYGKRFMLSRNRLQTVRMRTNSSIDRSVSNGAPQMAGELIVSVATKASLYLKQTLETMDNEKTHTWMPQELQSVDVVKGLVQDNPSMVAPLFENATGLDANSARTWRDSSSVDFDLIQPRKFVSKALNKSSNWKGSKSLHTNGRRREHDSEKGLILWTPDFFTLIERLVDQDAISKSLNSTTTMRRVSSIPTRGNASLDSFDPSMTSKKGGKLVVSTVGARDSDRTKEIKTKKKNAKTSKAAKEQNKGSTEDKERQRKMRQWKIQRERLRVKDRRLKNILSVIVGFWFLMLLRRRRR